MLIDERFTGPGLSPQLSWTDEPEGWKLTPDGLVVSPAKGTDFWQRTHYGFQVDRGPCLLAPVTGDFTLETEVAFEPVHQYDQAGLMVRLSADCWLKTSVEFEPDGPSRLGVVVTNQGWSDWSTQDFDGDHVALRVERVGGDYGVHARIGGGWTQLRICRLMADDGTRHVSAGIYACSPKGDGYRATFRRLGITADTRS
jgi:regulation of enolase protein 1 (concanavalin A-like superfamily)